MFPANQPNVNEMHMDDRHLFGEDERNLSSEIERLILGGNNDFVGRGSGDVQPKKEPSQDPCMFQRSTIGPFGPIPGQTPTGPPVTYAGVHGEMPQHWPPTSTQGASLSSMSLEMDKEPSMSSYHNLTPVPHYQTKQEPGQSPACQIQPRFDSGELPLRRMKYPCDDNLAVYGGDNCDNSSMESETEHRRWQQTQGYSSQPSSVETGSMPGSLPSSMPGSLPSMPGSLPTSMPGSLTGSMPSQGQEEPMQHEFEQDEYGEGPLHLLSQIHDKGLMAKVIDTLQQFNVIQQCINHQNKHKQTPLFLAVQAGNIALVGWLLHNGADPNIQGTLYTDRDEYMWRGPLHLAVMMGDAALSVVRLLLTKSLHTDINLASHGDKLTPLHLALKCHKENLSCQQIVNELLDHNADINIREQSSSKTPFILAIQTRDVALIQGFLEKFPADKRRAILQDQTRSGDTCLHIAAGLSRFPSNQKEMLLRYLVTQGANGNVPNNVKELPRDFARTEWDRIKNL